MSIEIVTGSAGLIGSEACKKFHTEGFDVIGIDNDMRARFFGPEASTADTRRRLQASLKRYQHQELDIRDTDQIDTLIARMTPYWEQWAASQGANGTAMLKEIRASLGK